MAFRRRSFRRLPRRFKRRWDMQTFRECERQFDLDVTGASTCSDPQTFADYVCGIGPSTAAQTKSGASRSVTFGGGHLRLRYNLAIVNDSNMPCHVTGKFITSLVVLPLLEDELTPSYIPNLAIARSQLSVVPATQSDTDEDILWSYDNQLNFTNITCIGCDDEDCAPGCDQNGLPSDNVFWQMKILDGVLHGRDTVDVQIRARRRLKERQALFLLSAFVCFPSGGCATHAWPIHRNVYFRYAIR